MRTSEAKTDRTNKTKVTTFFKPTSMDTFFKADFKWPEGDQKSFNYEGNFPTFTKIMKNIHKLPNLYDNLIDEIHKSTKLSKEEIMKNLEYGQGGIISLATDTKTIDEENISWDKKELIRLERRLSQGNSEDLEVAVVYLAITLIHEEVHRGDLITNKNFSGQWNYAKQTSDGITPVPDDNLPKGKQDYETSLFGHRGIDVEVKVFGAPASDWVKGADGYFYKTAGFAYEINQWFEDKERKKRDKEILYNALGKDKVERTAKILLS